MPDTQPTPASPDPAAYATEETILDLFLYGDSHRPLTLHEVGLEIGSEAVAADAIANLHAAGLIHKTSDGFLFASRAAVHHHNITL
jgi:hypothetical protein